MRITVNALIRHLSRLVEEDPRVGYYDITWSNASYQKLEVRHDGKWVMLGKLPVVSKGGGNE